MKYMVTNLQTTINSNMMITVNDIGRGINIDLGTGKIPPIFIEKLYRGTFNEYVQLLSRVQHSPTVAMEYQATFLT